MDTRTFHLVPKPRRGSGPRPPSTYPSTPESRPQQLDKESSSASSCFSAHAHQSLISPTGALQAHGATAPHRSLLAIHLHLAPASSTATKATGPHNAQTQIPQQLPSLHPSQG
ncbi:NFE4 isoform 2 [Pongo abelii]|uniref:NFE4 isoform 2 n=1 Tax=Pongo abelii TaxID=9601 RepID=A0A2J8VL96_PONAB|nr:NFE4 isoform 2 [Pongo abelii]